MVGGCRLARDASLEEPGRWPRLGSAVADVGPPSIARAARRLIDGRLLPLYRFAISFIIGARLERIPLAAAVVEPTGLRGRASEWGGGPADARRETLEREIPARRTDEWAAGATLCFNGPSSGVTVARRARWRRAPQVSRARRRPFARVSS